MFGPQRCSTGMVSTLLPANQLLEELHPAQDCLSHSAGLNQTPTGAGVTLVAVVAHMQYGGDTASRGSAICFRNHKVSMRSAT